MAFTFSLLMTFLVLGCRVAYCENFTIDCGETSVITLCDEKLEELSVSGLDEIVISRQRLNDTDGLDSVCITTISSKTFTLDLKDCDPYIEEDNETIKYTWTVRNQPYIDESVVVQRFTDNCFNVCCVFEREQLLEPSGLGSGIDPEIEKITLNSEESSGEFDIELTVYEDENCTNELENEGVIQVPDYIFAKVELVNQPDSTNLYVQIEKCKATPTSDANDPVYYSIIESGCAASNLGDPAGSINVRRNYEIQYGTFQFRSFVWTNDFDDFIFLHCEVKICDSDADGAECDSLNCPSGRKRRDVDAESHLVVFGPVRVSSKTPSSSCAHNNGGCSELCNEIDGNVVCSCNKGKVLMHDGRTCYNVNEAPSEVNEVPFEVNKIPSEHISDGSINLMMIVVMVVSCTSVIISCGLWLRSREESNRVVKI